MVELIERKESFREALRNFPRRIIRCVRGYVEVGLITLGGLVIPRLPRRAIHRLAIFLGQSVYIFGFNTRRIAYANLDVVYGDTKTKQEKKSILRASFRHAALVILDYFWFSRQTAERVAMFCKGEGEAIKRWVAGGFPGLVVTAHVGNWELAGQYVMSCGRNLWSVYRPIGTKKTLKALLRFRQTIGQRVIARKGAMKGVLRALRKNDLVAVLLDQHTNVNGGGIYLDFFGLPATFSTAPATLANHQSVPICIACARHDPEADTYRVVVYDEISGAETAAMSPEAITERIISVISQMILDAPEQWLWAYRRWKRYRPEDDASRFPFYARQEVSE